MHVVILTYRAPLADIDRLMPRHVRFLEEATRAGYFLAAGRQEPRTGGIILATGLVSPQLEQIMEQDPFVVEKAASFEIIQFRTSLHHPRFKTLADPGTRTVGVENP